MQGFYQRRDEIAQYVREFESLPADKADAFYRNHQAKIDLHDIAREVQGTLTKLRRERDLIEEDEEISEETRDEQIEAVEEAMKAEVDFFNKEYRRDVLGL